jgi:hypothetical protein
MGVLAYKIKYVKIQTFMVKYGQYNGMKIMDV